MPNPARALSLTLALLISFSFPASATTTHPVQGTNKVLSPSQVETIKFKHKVERVYKELEDFSMTLMILNEQIDLAFDQANLHQNYAGIQKAYNLALNVEKQYWTLDSKVNALYSDAPKHKVNMDSTKLILSDYYRAVAEYKKAPQAITNFIQRGKLMPDYLLFETILDNANSARNEGWVESNAGYDRFFNEVQNF